MADTAVAHGHGTDHGAHHTTTGLSNNKLAMWVFLGSESVSYTHLTLPTKA